VEDLLATSSPELVASLTAHHQRLFGAKPSASQVEAWHSEYATTTAALQQLVARRPEAQDWGVLFEYELPLEGGRRPDLVVLAGGGVAVVEFKTGGKVRSQGAVDQVLGYARDLAEYHEGTRGRAVTPILVTDTPLAYHNSYVRVASRSTMVTELDRAARPGHIELKEWIRAPYVPLPSLVEAARRIFRHEPLPHVKRAESAGIPHTVELISRIIEEARATQERHLVFVKGVPGSGKTLVGLRLVYEQAGDEAISTFLSGNGPLVKVLGDALKSRVFVRDLHAFIKTYGLSERVPRQHVLVFDEAQRAWDRGYMQYKRGIDASEADLLLRVGSELPGWAVLVGLLGEGQEIYSGEEGGVDQWTEALASCPVRWRVHCPPDLAGAFPGDMVETHPELNLTVSMRSRRAEHLHRWVAALLDGRLDQASSLATQVRDAGFSLYVTDSIASTRTYLEDRYRDEPTRRYGLVASSHDKLLPSYGIDNSWLTTSRVRPERWFNADPSSPDSCCSLDQPVTEFGCQGLELDMAVACWGADLVWDGRWRFKPIRRRYPQREPEAILSNVYRVLLTRGRDGLIVYVPPDPVLRQTADALRGAGMEDLEGALLAADRP